MAGKESLVRAVSGQSLSNYPAIIEGFLAKGIPESEILPRENVFTYAAWRALGHQVCKGEKGVPVLTWVTAEGKKVEASQAEGEERGYRFPRTTTVFHVSQVKPIEENSAVKEIAEGVAA